ncbi:MULTISPECIES: PEP-CTERM sorting domain-containing protein [unclassified Duganella]|uniref:PEP-CTERM sorting domain-containing protein n=1 Tax=unclassified Duganella TaxID=2636909 RepID=UPI001E31B594|nr:MULTISPECIES: PEP-CTERM sorting domain-containing protein [unclassified Duganella]
MKRLIRAAILAVGLTTGAAKAAPIDFTYTVSGTTGNWTYDFSVTNNLGYLWQIYLFGVSLPNATNPNSTLGMTTGYMTHFSHFTENGSTVDFNVNWVDRFTYKGVEPGQTGHFIVSDTSTSALTEINWYAYAYTGNSSDHYTGGPHLGSAYAPGFQGLNETILPIPEPETYAMLLAGLGILGFAARRKRTAA